MNYGKKCTKIVLFCCFVATSLLPVASRASEKDYKNCIAVAYTQENYQGISWEIYEAGEYDLWWKIRREDPHPRKIFDLPNDSMVSLRVCPGYRITLYEHAELLGKSLIVEGDTPALEEGWSRQASSLTAFTRNIREVRKWMEAVRSAPGDCTVSRSDEAKITELLKDYPEQFAWLIHSGEPEWYGDTTDQERIEMGGFLVDFFQALGYDLSPWTPETFAQQMNNFYDWRKDLSVWRTACLVLNVDAPRYEKIFAQIQE